MSAPKAPSAHALAATLQARHPAFEIRPVPGGFTVERKTSDDDTRAS